MQRCVGETASPLQSQLTRQETFGFGAVADKLIETAKTHPRRCAVVCGNTSISYGSLLSNAYSLSERLETFGTSSAEPIGILCRLSGGIVFAVIYLGCLLARQDICLIDQSWRDSDVERLLQLAGVGLLLGDGCLAADSAIARDYPLLARFDDDSGIGIVARTKQGGAFTVRRAGDESVDYRQSSLFLGTSGTTGTPKLIRHSQDGMAEQMEAVLGGLSQRSPLSRSQIMRRLEAFSRRPRAMLRAARSNRVWLTSLSLARIGGHSFMLQALLSRGTLAVADSGRSDDLCRLAKTYRASIMALAPISAAMFVRAAEQQRLKFPSLLVIGLGGDRVPGDLVERLRRVIGCEVAVGYGTTEVGGVLSATDPFEASGATGECVGRPMGGVDVRIVDDKFREVSEGSVGKVICQVSRARAGTIIDGSSSTVLVDGAEVASMDLGPGDWIDTGDEGWFDGRGRLHITGRHDDVIVKAGTRIDPISIEEELEKCPGVRSAAVVGLTLRSGATRIVAAVELADDSFSCSALQIQVRESLGLELAPNSIIEVAAIGTTPDGKKCRGEIRAQMSGLLSRKDS